MDMIDVPTTLMNDTDHVVLTERRLGVDAHVGFPDPLVVYEAVPPKGKSGPLAVPNRVVVVKA